jgi:hypothetical protein
MINGGHIIVYSTNAEADRAFDAVARLKAVET